VQVFLFLFPFTRPGQFLSFDIILDLTDYSQNMSKFSCPEAYTIQKFQAFIHNFRSNVVYRQTNRQTNKPGWKHNFLITCGLDSEDASVLESEHAAVQDSEDAAAPDSEDAAVQDSEDADALDSEHAAVQDSEDAASLDSEHVAVQDSEDAASLDLEHAAVQDSEDAASLDSEHVAVQYSEHAASLDS